MTDNKTSDKPDTGATDEKDVEGHNMWIGPTISSDIARNRNKEIEQAAKERNRAKDAKGR